MDKETKAERAERACQGHMPGCHRAEIWLWTGCGVRAHIASFHIGKKAGRMSSKHPYLCAYLWEVICFVVFFFGFCFSVFSTVDTHYPYVTRQIPIKMFKEIFLQI